MTTQAPVPSFDGYPIIELIEDFRLAWVSRAIDDREITLQKQSRAFFQIAGAGHEALLLGLSHSLRPAYDWFFPYYRDRALMLGLGASPRQLLLQAVGSAEDLASGGRQMPCHWGDRDRNVITQSSPTGSQCLSAVGCAEATRYLVARPHLHESASVAHGDEVTYVSLGEGATSEGEFWEALNSACTLRLPIVFVIEDNGFAISVPQRDQAAAPIAELVAGFRGLAVWQWDGTDYFTSRRLGAEAVAHVRAGNGPALIHAYVTRPYSHSAADSQSKYRSKAELAEETARDPITKMRATLVAGGVLTEAEAEAIRVKAVADVAAASRSALTAARPDPITVADHVWAVPQVEEGDPGAAGTSVAFGEAITRTLADEMQRDARIRVFGQDVADGRPEVLDEVEGKGGVFGTTLGLQRRFGADRCYNAPLAEANIVGRGIGQALRGLRPAPEIQFLDYVWTAMQQIKSEAATIRWRSNGIFSCPMVLRIPIGGYLAGGGIWHSQCAESIFTHIPGLIVAFPSRARDAAGLLRTAFRHAQDPVLFLEHKHLLRQAYTRDPYPDDAYEVPFGRLACRRPGTDMTIVTWGATVQKSLVAAEALAAAGVATIEVLDLRTLAPWDAEGVAESVARTGRLLVVHEDTMTSGFGAEIAAWVSQHCFASLDAPVTRVAAQDCHVPYEPTLETAVLPQVADIETAAVELLQY